MIKKIVFTLLALQAFVFADFKSINVEEMLTLQKDGAALIDIRTPGEWKETGVIPGTSKIMFFDDRGKYDVQKFMEEFQKVVKDKNQPFVLICRTASRTKMVGKFLSKEMGYTHVKDLEGGIMFGWGKRETVK